MATRHKERMEKALKKGRSLGKSDKAKKKGIARLLKAIKKPEPAEKPASPDSSKVTKGGAKRLMRGKTL